MARDMTPNAEETARGFTRPFRTYTQHTPCSSKTKLGRYPSQQLATDPASHPYLWCDTCMDRFIASEFTWVDEREDGDVNAPGEVTAYVVGT